VATWEELSDEALRAAKKLFDDEIYRSSISRSYYAVYCRLTSVLVRQRIDFARGWNNPAHEQLPRLVRGRLRVPEWDRRTISTALRRLRLSRENADYRPPAPVGRSEALECLHDAAMIVRRLEKADE
jgi:uncharacterized protein (UPF0332 family)